MSFIRIAIISFAIFLSGCADTPENRQFWQQMGAAMQGAGDNLNRNAAQMRAESSGANNTNCTTNYFGGQAQTTCTGPQRPVTNCTTNYYGSQAQTTCR
jgi:hypothetical protein